MKRVIAVDWSGARTGAKSKIWLAEVRGGRLARLESGRDRDEVVEHLIEVARADPDLVVGLDFAFSFPRWFAEKSGAPPIQELWSLVAEQGEDWLHKCPPPFWGKPGKPRPDLPEHHLHYRRTERQAAEMKGATPKSVFQIGGAGAVGTGSIRGMPHLARLAAAGFAIWPFHEIRRRARSASAARRPPLVIEIYPRLLTGEVIKSDFEQRHKYLTNLTTVFPRSTAHSPAGPPPPRTPSTRRYRPWR